MFSWFQLKEITDRISQKPGTSLLSPVCRDKTKEKLRKFNRGVGGDRKEDLKRIVDLVRVLCGEEEAEDDELMVDWERTWMESVKYVQNIEKKERVSLERAQAFTEESSVIFFIEKEDGPSNQEEEDLIAKGVESGLFSEQEILCIRALFS